MKISNKKKNARTEFMNMSIKEVNKIMTDIYDIMGYRPLPLPEPQGIITLSIGV